MLKEFILKNPFFYKLFVKLIRKKDIRKDFIKKLDLKPGDKILDIGCGPAEILSELPDYIDYTGFDNNEKYITDAKKRFKNRGSFFCETIGKDSLQNKFNETEKFNLILAMGVLHHLTDREVLSLMKLADKHLLPDAKLVTRDGCYTKNQSLIAKFLLKMDRGIFVRNEAGYTKLAGHFFKTVKSEINHNLINLPYTHITMKCIKEGREEKNDSF